MSLLLCRFIDGSRWDRASCIASTLDQALSSRPSAATAGRLSRPSTSLSVGCRGRRGCPACKAGHDDEDAMPDIKSLTAAELLRLYRKRELSPVEVTRDQLDRIEKFEPALNAFIIIDRDGALKAAKESEARWHKGEPVGLVDGIGATVKDNVWLKGFPSRRGSLTSAGHPDEGGCARGRAAARGRRRHSRQDHAARVRLDRRLPFAAHRHHAQSMEARPHARRLVRRRGLRGVAQSRPPAHRHRRRGLDPHPLRLHRRVRHQAELRPRAPPIRPLRSASSRIPGR